MLHPSTELRFINDEIGYGVVATKLIPRGTITWALDELDQLIAPERVTGMSKLHQDLIAKYAYVDAHGRHVLCWDLARYMNHSCEANCLSSSYEFEVAIRDIYPGEQLTDDYGGLNIETSFRCACGSPVCRGYIHPDDILRLADHWDSQLAEPLDLMHSVAQPLWPILRCKDLLEAGRSGSLRLPSMRANYYARSANGR